MLITAGTYYGDNARDDLLNSRLIIMWGWNPANTIAGINTNWYLARAKEAGAKVIAVDPRYTDSAVTFTDEWIALRPGTNGAMLLAMAWVILTGPSARRLTSIPGRSGGVYFELVEHPLKVGATH